MISPAWSLCEVMTENISCTASATADFYIQDTSVDMDWLQIFTDFFGPDNMLKCEGNDGYCSPVVWIGRVIIWIIRRRGRTHFCRNAHRPARAKLLIMQSIAPRSQFGFSIPQKITAESFTLLLNTQCCILTWEYHHVGSVPESSGGINTDHVVNIKWCFNMKMYMALLLCKTDAKSNFATAVAQILQQCEVFFNLLIISSLWSLYLYVN